METVPKFVADRMLGRLARWLRLLGADVVAGPALHGSAMLRLARTEGRVALTRDKRLRLARQAMFIESNDLPAQLRQVLAGAPFDPLARAFTRCTLCNTPLSRVSKDVVARRVPPFVYASQTRFAQCESCGHIYWSATHLDRVRHQLRSFGL